MTAAQRATVNQLVADGFKVVETCRDIIRLTKGSDARLVRPDGSQRRAHHVEHKRA